MVSVPSPPERYCAQLEGAEPPAEVGVGRIQTGR